MIAALLTGGPGAAIAPDRRLPVEADSLDAAVPRRHAEPTRSELERALRRALREARLPLPVSNRSVLGREVDVDASI